ncbi:MAG: hypothetical protein AAF797_15220 [Planctomycetota bacterium]
MASTNKKFIPNGDPAFAEMAQRFASTLRGFPEKYNLPPEEMSAVAEAVEGFRGALQKARRGGVRSEGRGMTIAKDEARAAAERVIRRVAGVIRSDDRVSVADKQLLGIKPRRKAGGASRDMEKEAAEALRWSPDLRFVGAVHRAQQVPEHELEFSGRRGDKGQIGVKGRPAGVARLELFVELLPPEIGAMEALNLRPGESGLGVHYLRSYVKSPVMVVPPMADRPMRVVYWGRWADASGAVGPMSGPAVAWVEGGTHHLMGVSVRHMDGTGTGAEDPRVQHVAVAELEKKRDAIQAAGLVSDQATLGEVDGSGAGSGVHVTVAVLEAQRALLGMGAERSITSSVENMPQSEAA